MGMEVFATLAGATIQGQIVGVYHAKSAQVCSQLNYSKASLRNVSSPLTDTLQNTVWSIISITPTVFLFSLLQ